MLRVSNMITMKRMYTAVSSLSLVYAPIRSQVLNPRRRNVMFHTEAAFLQAWAAENRFNNSQLSAISAAVNLRQGFLLVQGPPGTGKTTTIVGKRSLLVKRTTCLLVTLPFQLHVVAWCLSTLLTFSCFVLLCGGVYRHGVSSPHQGTRVRCLCLWLCCCCCFLV